MKKKILIVAITAIVLIAILAFFAVLAPGSRKDNSKTPSTTAAVTPDVPDETTPTETQPANIKDDIPDDVNFGGKEITTLYWSDYSMTEFFTEEITGSLIGDEIYYRNQELESALGVTLNYVGEKGSSDYVTEFSKKVETDISSGACEYDIIAGYSRTAPVLALSGQVKNLAESKYMNYDKPWWPADMVDQCLINNKLFFCSGDISTNMLWMMIGTFYNKSMIADRGLEDPTDIALAGDWTMDKMIEYCTNTYVDVDGGGGEKDKSDIYGYVIYNINLDAMLNSTGLRILEKNASSEIIISPTLTSQKTYDIIERLGAFLHTNDAYFFNGTSVRNIFFEERSLFITDRVFIVSGKDNGSADKIEFSYGILPQPKYDATQDNYVTNLGHPFTMYAVSAGVNDGDDFDASSAVLERLASESYKRITPLVFEESMKIKYADDEKAAGIYDILRGTVCFDLGRFYSIETGKVYDMMRTQIINNTNTFASQYKGLSKTMQKGIEKIAKAFAD